MLELKLVLLKVVKLQWLACDFKMQILNKDPC